MTIFRINIRNLPDAFYVKGFKSNRERELGAHLNVIGSTWIYTPETGDLTRRVPDLSQNITRIEDNLKFAGVPYSKTHIEDGVKF